MQCALIFKMVFGFFDFTWNKLSFQLIPQNNYENQGEPSKINYFDQSWNSLFYDGL